MGGYSKRMTHPWKPMGNIFNSQNWCGKNIEFILKILTFIWSLFPVTVLRISKRNHLPMNQSHKPMSRCHVSKPTVVKSQEFMKGEQPVTVSHMSRLVQTEKDWRAMTNVAKPRETLEYRRDRRKYNARSVYKVWLLRSEVWTLPHS